MNCFATRLFPNSDLKKEIVDFFKSKNISSGIVLSSVGSLKQANLRFSNQKVGTVLTGPFEILSLNGTLSIDGVHLHLCISDDKGQTFGGHLLDHSLIHTTCELVIAEIPGHTFNRELDPQTQYMELKIK
jgi:predicted DNA-binding protein with PD1-like motif